MRRKSQCDQILDVLADGEWHTSRELYSLGIGVIHSRMSELDKRGRGEGFAIERERTGHGPENFRYRLHLLTGRLFNLDEVA